ncbi:MAG: outer membrane beta-barrel protein [Rikenellaceae bacterium]
MKNLKFFIVALMLFTQGAAYAVGLDMGVEFALSQANFKLKDSGVSLNNELGYGVGVSAKVDLSVVKVGPELWYYRNTATNDDGKLKSNSIDLPVVVSYNILGPLAIEAGPSFSLLSSGKFEYDGGTMDLNRIRPEMGYVVGARVTLFKLLMVSGRFNGCFSRQDVDFDGGTYGMRYNAWNVAVGVKF